MGNEAPITNVDFFFGGNATFTVENPHGEYYTFKITKGKVNAKYPNPAYFIGVMTGCDNESSYSYMGVIKSVDQSFGTIKITKNSKISQNDKRVAIAQWAIRVVMLNKIPEGYKILHAGKCCVCGLLRASD